MPCLSTLGAGVAAARIAGVKIGTAGVKKPSRPSPRRVDLAVRRRTLVGVGTAKRAPRVRDAAAASRRSLAELARAVDGSRQRRALLLASAGVPLLTIALCQFRTSLSFTDDLLLYLLVAVGITVLGGFWPGVVTAVASSVVLNWFFAPPLHTLTIAEPQSLLALLLFVSVAVTVSAVVHLAARRATQAEHSAADAVLLHDIARSVLGGADTAAGVLSHFTRTYGPAAQLFERVGISWVKVADSSGAARAGERALDIVVAPRADLQVRFAGCPPTFGRLVLDGVAAQAAAALDRERLRIQAAQAETLAEANRVRTALLTAVSHDLRTPLASVKAAVSSLRQGDVCWSPDDEAALLATIEEGADRLAALISNLLDASRVATGSLKPFIRPISCEEVVPLALRGLEGSESVRLALPDELPLILTDAALLERVVANLVSNAIRFSPQAAGPEVGGYQEGDRVVLTVADHGPGVPEQDRERIFEPFQRLGDRSSSGVGLGLAVARGFVEAMGCRITASQTPGGGLTFRVWLPVAPEPALAVHASLPALP
jgi:two-component system sensor histidine kinase KdpD